MISLAAIAMVVSMEIVRMPAVFAVVTDEARVTPFSALAERAIEAVGVDGVPWYVYEDEKE